ncbi:MAG TPA: tRNA threonylcarbamoyladenosine dehydratase [Clostridiales bacterium]|nr:tRNA threonylcarbamoyladenosine dehydratase [Clostridiales bacterium]
MSDFLDRTRSLIGSDNVDKLKRSHVAVFGLGGVGSFVVEALVRSGIGEITLVDSDDVDITNINRQIIATVHSVGKAKTEVSKERVLSINPECLVHTIKGMYLPETRNEFWGNYDYVVDAIDNVTAKIDLVAEAKKRNIPIISSMGTGNKLRPDMFEIADINETSVCPLCRIIRKELRARQIDKLKVVYSKEEPIKTGMRKPASIAFVPSSAGLLIASEVIKDLIDIS